MNNKNVAKVFKTLGNERRFLITKHLFNNKELTVGQISELINLSFRSTSKHLTVLTSMDFVETRQVSLNRFYSINRISFPKQFIKFFTN